MVLAPIVALGWSRWQLKLRTEAAGIAQAISTVDGRLKLEPAGIDWIETGDQRRPYRAGHAQNSRSTHLQGDGSLRACGSPLSVLEAWTIIQVALMFAIIVAGVAGPAWPMDASSLRRGAGILIAIGGVAMLAGGIVGLRHALTPFPRPLERARLQVGGAYRLVRHPIYGGLILLALGWSLTPHRWRWC